MKVFEFFNTNFLGEFWISSNNITGISFIKFIRVSIFLKAFDLILANSNITSYVADDR